MAGSKDKTTEQIYDELPENPDGGKGKGQGSGGGYMDGDGMGEDIIQEGAPLSEHEIQEIEAQTKIDLAEAAQIAKAKGKLPGALAEFVADILNPKTPWHEILERYMTDMAKGDYSWARPNRRFMSQRMYLPSVGRVPKLGEVVIQVDISGSVSRDEIAYYNGHMKRIIEQTHPEKVHVIYTDTEVQRHEEFDNPEDVQINFYSGGGTDMPAGFDFVAEKGIDPQVFICLTDGYTDFGDAPGYPVIWCISSDIESTHGETIHFEMGE
jgi:predicted metal-dependent peptidase